jgi:serine protease inhibitor
MATKKCYSVSLTFTDILAENPLEATKKILKWIEEDSNTMIYDVIDEETNDKFTVDLSEDDEDAVLPNND